MFKALSANILLILAINVAPTVAMAQVMGLRMGESASSIKAKGVKLTPNPGLSFYYFATNLPQPAAAVPEVTLRIHPSLGLCTILAASMTHDDNMFGTETRRTYERLRAMLEPKYGGPTSSFDFVNSGSIWNSDQYFMIGLQKEERSLVSYWLTKEGARLPQGIQNISLEAMAISSSRGYVLLRYESNNHSRCVDSLRAAENRGL
jgi:hypothetical protein